MTRSPPFKVGDRVVVDDEVYEPYLATVSSVPPQDQVHRTGLRLLVVTDSYCSSSSQHVLGRFLRVSSNHVRKAHELEVLAIEASR